MTLELPSALLSSGRSSEIPETSGLYAWVVGSWTLEVRCYAGVDVTGRGLAGELQARGRRA